VQALRAYQTLAALRSMGSHDLFIAHRTSGNQRHYADIALR
jgi:hypothetical protein